VAYAPDSVVLDAADGKVARRQRTRASARVTRSRPMSAFTGYNTHQEQRHRQHCPGTGQQRAAGDDDAGLPEHPWDLSQNIESASGGSKSAAPASDSGQDRRPVEASSMCS